MKKLQIGSMPKIATDVENAFDRLRVNLSFCCDRIKTIMITSSGSGEGKTFVSMGLWKRMSEAGIPTLMIDCDLRNSQVISRYNIYGAEGLDGVTQYLSGKAELEDVLYETDVHNGYLLPVTSLVEKPEILLASGRFSQMIKKSKNEFGCVIIDTPSIASSPDAVSIAPYCDGAMIVVRSASTSRESVCDCVQALQCAGTPLLGIVLNSFDANNKSSAFYYHHRK